jgi:D-alanyl-lipoteichoic acid acyltransferase DltB (MBOAT superfamily)
VNYNAWSFWLLFGCLIVFYWRLNHRQQNRLLLAASYIFYGFWDYRFLFLILISTVIDFIGGLGVAGIELSARRQRRLFVLIVSSALILCSNVHYAELWTGLVSLDGGAVLRAIPKRWSDFAIPLGAIVACLFYSRLLVRLYRAPADRRRRQFLAVSMIANLAILGFFKYFDFFAASFENLLRGIGFNDVPNYVLGIVLPVGISFYTFQAMSYTIDLYRGTAEPTDDFADFALFVCFFPHLVAGPIMRAHTLLPQVVHPRRLKPGAIEEGFVLVVFGLFKKIVIADNVAPIANAVFFRFADGTSAGLSGLDAIVGLYAFALQIYGDFSGYSSIARGISKWLGFELVINFHLPYLAVSPSDFWRRWHISLSTWLRDYLYIPLGGNRGGTYATYRNLMLTMLLGGLWHGANWTFVAWGLYHGILLCSFRALGVSDPSPNGTLRTRLVWLGRVVVMFHLTCLGWLLFRADSFGTVLQIGHRILTDLHWTPFAASSLATIAFYGVVFEFVEWALDGEVGLNRLLRSSWSVRSTVYAYVILMLIIFPAESSREFIYFQF